MDQAGSVLRVGEEGEGSEGGNERNEGDGRKRRKGKGGYLKDSQNVQHHTWQQSLCESFPCSPL